MSYNITSVDVLTLDARIKTIDVVRLLRARSADMPESCFLRDIQGPILRSTLGDEIAASISSVAAATWEKVERMLGSNGDIDLELLGFAWCGGWSGNSYEEVLIKEVAPRIRGVVEAVFTWEGGDYRSGLRIQDGVAVECDVAYRLVAKVWP